MAFDLPSTIDAAAKEWGLDPAFLHSVSQAESGQQANGPNSSAGALGPLQVMPGTASDMGVTDPTDPTQNVYAGAKYLSGLLDRYQKPELALAAYNAGPQRVDDYLAGKASLPAETQAYVPKVAAAYKQIAGSRAPAASPSAASGASANVPPAPPSYQVASADTGSASDATPNPSAPPSSGAGSTSPPASSDSSPDPFTALMASASAAPSTGSAAAPVTTAPAASASQAPSTQPSAASSTASPDPFTALMATAHAKVAGDPNNAGILSNLGSGLLAGISKVGGTLNDVASAVDQRFEPLQDLDDNLGYTPDRQAANAARAKATAAQYAAGAGQTTAGQIGNVAGQVLTSLPFVETGAGAIGAGLGAGAEALGGAGTIAGRTLQAGRQLLTGSGNATTAGKVVSLATSGAAKGVAAGGVINGNFNDAGTNALYGVGGGLAGAAISPIAKGIMTLTGKAGSSILDHLAPAAEHVESAAPVEAPASPYDNDLASASQDPSATSGSTAAPAASFSTVPTRPVQPSEPGFDPASPAYTNLSPTDYQSFMAGKSPPASGSAAFGDNDLARGSNTAAPDAAPVNALASAQSVPMAMKPQGLVLTKAGANAQADKIVQMFAKGGDVGLTPTIDGGAFDAAESTGNPGIAALRSYVMNNNPSAGNLFAGIKDANNAARLQVLGSITGKPEDLDALEAARDADTSQAHDAAFSNAQPVDAQPFADQLQAAIDGKKGYPSVQKPLLDLQKTFQGVTQTDPQTGAVTADPQHLWNVRQEINAMISPKAAGTAQDGRQAAAQLIGLKPTLDDTIEGGAPGFKDFLQTYSDHSAKIDGMRWLQNQGIGITDSQGNVTTAKIDSVLKTLQRQQNASGATMADHVTPEQQQALVGLRDNLRQANSAVYRGKLPGSDTARNIGSNAFVNALSAGTGGGVSSHMLSSVAPILGEGVAGVPGAMAGLALTGVRHAAGSVGSRGSNMVMDALVNKLTNPAAFQKSVNALATASRR